MSSSGFLLDTNVVSEALRPRPDPRVLAWLRATAARAWLSVVTIGEIETGIPAVDALIAATAAEHPRLANRGTMEGSSVGGAHGRRQSAHHPRRE